LEANVGNFFKLGGAFFKNLTTGEKGASVSAKYYVGIDITRKVPSNLPIDSPAGQVTYTVSAWDVQHNLTTGENSASLSMGFALGLGGEISFDPNKFRQLASQCDHIVE